MRLSHVSCDGWVNIPVIHHVTSWFSQGGRYYNLVPPYCVNIDSGNVIILQWTLNSRETSHTLLLWMRYSISQEICTRFLLCCALLWLYIDWFSHIHQASLALWQFNDCPSASKATLMNMDRYFMWIHYERLHNHNKAKHNKTVCIFLGIYCMMCTMWVFCKKYFFVNEHHHISNYWPPICLFNSLFTLTPKETSKLCITSLCEKNPWKTRGFPSQGPVLRKVFPWSNIMLW